MTTTFDLSKNHQFNLLRTKGVSIYKHTTIPAIDEILEEDENGQLRNVKIRYVEGESSIYAHKQGDVDEKKIKPIIVIGYMKMVSAAEPLLLEYLQKSNYNAANPNRKPNKPSLYKEYNREAEYKKVVAEQTKHLDAKFKVKQMHITELRALLLVSDAGFDSRKVNEMSKSELEFECYRIAERNPEFVTEGLKSKSKRNKYLVMQAISQGILKYNENQEELSWANGNVISVAPYGKKAIDHFVSLTLEDNMDIDAIMDEIKRTVTYEIQQEKEDVVDKTTEHILFEKAVKLKVIEQKGQWYSYVNSEDEIEEKTQGHTAFIKKLEEDDELFMSIKKTIRELEKN